MPNDVLSAFVQQTYGSPQKAMEADKQADQREAIAKAFAEDAHKKAVTQLCRNQSIASAMNIPSKLKEGQLNNKTVPHLQMANYDHSLETKRLDGKLIKLDEPEEGLSNGSVEEMFNNVFSNDD